MSDATTDLTPQQKRGLLAKLLKAKASQEPEFHPLSYGQRALWFIHHLDPSSPAYNIMCDHTDHPDDLERATGNVVPIEGTR